MDKTGTRKPLLKAIAKLSYKHTTQYSDSDLVSTKPDLNLTDLCIWAEPYSIYPKLYSCKVEGDDLHRKCKGVKTSAFKQKITHQDYLDCLMMKTPKYVTFNNIRSRKHQITTETLLKKALSDDNNKRIIGGRITKPYTT